MAAAAAILRAMVDVVWVALRLDVRNPYGDAVFQEARPVRARVEQSRSISDGSDSMTRQTSTRVFMTDRITDMDRIWLPGEDPEDDTQARMPASVAELRGLDGNVTHYEVSL